MYSRNYQNDAHRERQSVPRGYGNTSGLRDSLLIPPEYRGEFLRRQPAAESNEEAPRTVYEDRQQEKPTYRTEGASTATEHKAEKRSAFVKRGSDRDHPKEDVSSADASESIDVDAPEISYGTAQKNSGGLISDLSSLLFGRGGEEDALLILGIGLLLINSRMERTRAPLFSGGQFNLDEDDIGLLLILLLLFS